MATIEKLLELLTLHSGKIVSSSSMDIEQIEQSQASGRFYVNDKGYGYSWEPHLKRMPETPEDVELFEKWYPLPVKLPDELKPANFLFPKSDVYGQCPCGAPMINCEKCNPLLNT